MKAGYKQTEVGVIPEDWEAKAIGDEIDLLTGFPFPSSGYSKYGVRLLRGSNVKRGLTDWSDEITQYWPAATRNLTRYTMMAGDLVISMDGSLVGRSYAQLEESDLPALLLQRVARIRATKLDVGYLRQFVGGDQFVKYVDSVKTVTAIPHISPADIRRFTIPVPPTVAEQRAIAEALGDADALLAGLDRLLAKKRDLKQAAMQQLITGQTRLPGFRGEWEVKRLGECLVSPPSYGINAPATPTRGNLPVYLRITDIDDNGRFCKDDRVAVDHPAADRYFLAPNEIVFARTGASVGKTYLYNPVDGAMVFAGFLIRARINAEILDPVFFFNFTTSQEYWNWVRVMSMRSGQPGINGNEFAALEFKTPSSLAEQTAIAGILSDMDVEIAALERRREKTLALKQGMMQELLTGRTRLV